MTYLCILEAKDDYLVVDYTKSYIINIIESGHAIFSTNILDKNCSMTNYIYSIEHKLKIFKDNILISKVKDDILYYEYPLGRNSKIHNIKNLIIKFPSKKELAKFKLIYYKG